MSGPGTCCLGLVKGREQGGGAGSGSIFSRLCLLHPWAACHATSPVPSAGGKLSLPPHSDMWGWVVLCCGDTVLCTELCCSFLASTHQGPVSVGGARPSQRHMVPCPALPSVLRPALPSSPRRSDLPALGRRQGNPVSTFRANS